MSNVPSQTTPVYCSDEDILVYAGGDFAPLCPAWQQMATGNDGVFAPGAPWVLTSASINFAVNGVSPNQVVWLTAPKSQFPGGGHFLAIDQVSDNAITLRRPYMNPGVGQPPASAVGLTGVSFTVNTFDPQIEEASYELKQRFCIDENVMDRTSSWIYDLQVLRVAAVCSVLVARYTQETRTERGDFDKKVQRLRQKLDDALAQVQVRWGPFGNSAEPSTLFGCKLSR